jgi:CRP/FNR family transcriptional regulator, cyclic AMP receptor protein
MCPEADLLKGIPLFELLDDRGREDLATHLEVERFAADTSIFEIGDPGEAVYIISAGEVEIFFRNDTGEQIILERSGKGDFFGEISFLDGGSRSASVRATTDTEVLRLDRDELAKFLESRPDAAMHLLAALVRRLRTTVDRLRHTASRNVNEQMTESHKLLHKIFDAIAEFAGSIPFLMIHVVLFTVWLTVNSVQMPGIPQFDPYPFGFLTLSVSLEAIFLSVFVLLSQNRQVAKDRVRSEVEYDVNLKAELEIAHLHEKLDRLTAESLRRLERIQRELSKRPAEENRNLR